MKFFLRDVAFSYSSKVAGKKLIFNHLDLAIESGECLGVIGQEGAGKTTLLQLLDALVRPDSGIVSIDDEDIWKVQDNLPKIRCQIGFSFQFPEQHFFCETVEEELIYAGRNFGLTSVAPGGSRKALEEVGLVPEEHLGRSPFALSIGEARRLAIASVLILQPRAMLLDEPTVGLDGEGVDRTLAIMKQAKRRGTTLVVVSHELDFLAEIADRIIVLANGVQADESARRLLTDSPRLALYGYDPPEVVEYTDELRQRGMNIPPDVLTMDEMRAKIGHRPLDEESPNTTSHC